jgi:hypothetical protein
MYASSNLFRRHFSDYIRRFVPISYGVFGCVLQRRATVACHPCACDVTHSLLSLSLSLSKMSRSVGVVSFGDLGVRREVAFRPGR